MCYGDDARPPAPPAPGPVGGHGDLMLTSADGTQLRAYYAHPESALDRVAESDADRAPESDADRAPESDADRAPVSRSDHVPVSRSDKAIVILPDVRGLHSFYQELAVRFAEAGLHAVAIDYFGRTTDHGERGEDFSFQEHVERTEPAQIAEDTGAAVAWLRQQAGVRSVYTVGFCFGGSNSWGQSAAGHDLAGCIGFYGRPSRVLDLVPLMRSPLLLMAAGADFTPVEEVEAFAKQARDSGVSVRMEVFPGAPHSFFDRTFGAHRADCGHAWRTMLEFIDEHATKG